MKYTIPIDKKGMACASTTEKISVKSALMVARKINGMKLAAAKNFLQDMLDEKKSIRGKFYTSSAGGVLRLLKSAEDNAAKKGFDLEALKIKISVHKGPNMHRARRKRHFGTKMKMTNLQVVLVQMKKEKTDEHEKQAVVEGK